MKGVSFVESGYLKAAADAFEKALMFYPGLPSEVYFHLSQIYQRLGEFEKAQDMRERLNNPVPALPDDPTILERRLANRQITREDLAAWSLNWWHEGRCQQAKMLMETYVRRFPGDPQGYYNLATMLTRLEPELRKRRISLYREAISHGISYEMNANACYRGLAHVLQEDGQVDAAEKMLMKAENPIQVK